MNLFRRRTYRKAELLFCLLVFTTAINIGHGEGWELSPREAHAHVIMVNKRGQHLDPARKWELYGDGARRKRLSFPDNVAAIELGLGEFCRTNTTATPRVVVFVHGGLNSYSSSKERLSYLLRRGMLQNGYYPVLLVWDSGFIDSYLEHLFSIRQGEVRPLTGKITFPVVFLSDVGKGLARLPLTLSGRWYNDLKTAEVARVWDSRTKAWEDLEAQLAQWQANEPAGQDAVISLIRPPQPEGDTRKLDERTYRLLSYTITQPTKIALLPLVDGLGTEAWENMVRRTKTMFQPPVTYDFPVRYRKRLFEKQRQTEQDKQDAVKGWMARRQVLGSTNVSPDGTMFRFAKQLEIWTTNQTFSPQLRWQFFGHSMGTMVLNELFRVAPDIRAEQVTYMAAACSIRSFQESLVPYLRRQQLLRAHTVPFYNLCLHRIRERDNSMDNVDLMPRGTLLNYIDEIFTSPSTITDRTLGSWENVIRSLPDMPKDLWPQIHNVCFDLLPWSFAGSNTNQPQNHSSFASEFEFWRDDFVKEPPKPSLSQPEIRQSPAQMK